MRTVLSIQVCEDPGMICWDGADPGMVCREGEEERIIDAKKYYTIQYYYVIQLVLYLVKVVPAPPPPRRGTKRRQKVKRYLGVAYLLTYSRGWIFFTTVLICFW